MPVFPSLAWFQALREQVNHDESYARIGTCDATMGVAVGDQAYLVTFEAFEVAGVREATPDQLAEADFVLAATPERWREILDNIRDNHGAGPDYTLNTLDLEDEDFVRGPKGEFDRDKFYRYNQSLQHFFDASAKLATSYE